MLWPFLGLIFTISVLLGLALIVAVAFRLPFWKRNKSKILLAYVVWFLPYFTFILFCTGPLDLSQYPPQYTSSFKLPWKAGDVHFVSQGNRSFTSHRGIHLNAWDFVMPMGTSVLAAAEGKVVRVEMDRHGIGLRANIIVIEHENGIRTGYAHLKKGSAQVKLGDHVLQGQVIALSGLVGQTLFPHLHFFATDAMGLEPRPISFKEVPGGVPLAEHFYSSANTAH